MKALVLGATGAIGSDLLEQLLQDDNFDRVDIFVRRPWSGRGVTVLARRPASLPSRP